MSAKSDSWLHMFVSGWGFFYLRCQKEIWTAWFVPRICRSNPDVSLSWIYWANGLVVWSSGFVHRGLVLPRPAWMNHRTGRVAEAGAGLSSWCWETQSSLILKCAGIAKSEMAVLTFLAIDGADDIDPRRGSEMWTFTASQTTIWFFILLFLHILIELMFAVCFDVWSGNLHVPFPFPTTGRSWLEKVSGKGIEMGNL